MSVSMFFILGPSKLFDTEKLFPRALTQRNRGFRTPPCGEPPSHTSHRPATLGRRRWVASRKLMEKSDAECSISEMNCQFSLFPFYSCQRETFQKRVRLKRIQSILVCLQEPLSSCLCKVTRIQFSLFIFSLHVLS